MTLYVIRAVKTGLVKVGISDSFDARLSKLRREGPDELEVLKVFHGEREYIEGLEKEIHAELRGLGAHHHLSGSSIVRKSRPLLSGLKRNSLFQFREAPKAFPSAPLWRGAPRFNLAQWSGISGWCRCRRVGRNQTLQMLVSY